MKNFVFLITFMLQISTLCGQSVNYYSGNATVKADSVVFNIKETNGWKVFYEVENAKNELFHQEWKEKNGNYPDYRLPQQAFLKDKDSFYSIFKEVVSQDEINIAKSYVRVKGDTGLFAAQLVVLASGKVVEVRFVFGNQYAHFKPETLRNLEYKLKEDLEFFIPDKVTERVDYMKGVNIYIQIDNL